jgi:trk system potassium uptake protein
MNALGRAVVEKLAERGHNVVAIDTDPEKLEGLGVRTVLGNAEYMSVLEEAGISSCSLLVSTLQIEDVNRLLAYRARKLGIPSVIHVFDRGIEEELRGLDVAHLLNSRAAGVRRHPRGTLGPWGVRSMTAFALLLFVGRRRTRRRPCCRSSPPSRS